MKTIIPFLLILLYTSTINAQILDKLTKKVEKAVERTVERKVEQKAEKTTEDGMDKVLNKKNKTEGNPTTKDSKSGKKSKSAKTAKDFVAGTTVLASEDFSQDAIGDFPVNWSTNSSGEVVTFSDSDVRWLKLTDNGNYMLNDINKLPKNFTFEFDLYSTDAFSFYSTSLKVGFIESKKKTDYLKWGEFKNGTNGVIVTLHPQVAGNVPTGHSFFTVIDDGGELMKNEVELNAYNNNQNTAKVQFWRQDGRLRMYVNGEKIWDLPNAFQDANYNNIVFYIHGYHGKQDKYYISNLRLAEAGKDTRHKLIETGTFTTNEILFDVNKATIKPSSTTVLKELGDALKDNPKVKVNIIGHTDSDGKDTENQKLSEQRAESVKNYLFTNFGIEKARMTSEGKGESEPISSNTSEDSKKQNRRVEFKIIR
jgi:outer membrane protein OmpA-like peptidoglycan-associated protein